MSDLDIVVNSQTVAAAAVDLDRLAAAAVEGGSAVDRFTNNARLATAVMETTATATQQVSTAARVASASLFAMNEAQQYAVAGARAATAAAVGQTEALHGLRFAVGNVSAQFQDIAVTSAMGMNAWTIGLQQGTQLASVLGMQGGGLTQVVRTLGAALGTVLSPLSLVTIGLVTASAAAIQWGMAAAKGGETASEALERQQDATMELLKGYEDIADSVQEAFDVVGRSPEGVIFSDLGKSLAEQAEIADRARVKIEGLIAVEQDLDSLAADLDAVASQFGDDSVFTDSAVPAAVLEYRNVIDLFAVAVDGSKVELIEAAIAARELYNTTKDPAIRQAASEAYDYARNIMVAEDAAFALRRALALLQNQAAMEWATGPADEANEAIERLTKSTQGLRTERERASDDLGEALGSGDAIQRMAAQAKYEELMEGYDKRDAEREAARGARGQSPTDKWETETQNYASRLEMMAIENEMFDEGTYAREKRLQTEELLAKALDAGMEDTPDLRKEIAGLAEDYARLALEAQGVETTLANRTVWEELKDELRDLDEQLAAGVISWDTYNQAAGIATANALSSTLGALAGLSAGLSSAFEDNKALSVATAVLKGAESIASSYAVGAGIGGPVVGAAFAAVAAITAAANVAAVLAVDKNSTSITNSGGAGQVAPVANEGTGLHVNLLGNPNTPTTLGHVENTLREIQEFLGQNGQQLAITYKGG